MQGTKRCEREWDAATAAGVQTLVRELCGRCLCEDGLQCPLFSYGRREVEAGEVEALPFSA